MKARYYLITGIIWLGFSVSIGLTLSTITSCRQKIDHVGKCPRHIVLNGQRVPLDLYLSTDSCKYFYTQDPNHIWFADIPLAK